MADHLRENGGGIDTHLAEIAASPDRASTLANVRAAVARAGLAILVAGTPAMAQEYLAPNQAQQRTISQLDPEAQIVDGVLVVASSAEAACSLLNTGQGFYVANAAVDPRILAIGGIGGGVYEDVEVDEAQIMPEMPAGFDPCIWTALVDLAPNAQDVRAIVQFESIGDGTGTLPPPPLFINRTLSPTLIGLAEGALPTEIGPRWAELRLLLSQAKTAAGSDFYAPVSVLEAEESRIGAEAARLDAAQANLDADEGARDADAAVRDAEVARARAEAARALADALERAVTN